MKKLLLVLSICLVSFALNAQTTGWETNVKGCFCCSDLYNLPTKPHLEGPVSLDCAGGGKYCTDACPTATFNWSVSPSAPFTGQGTRCIVLGSPLTPGVYTITITIVCGNKKVNNSMQVKVSGVQNCTANFLATITMLSNGMLNINTVPDTKGGVEHWWGIVYNGTYPNCTIPCVSIPLATITSGGTFAGVHETAAIPTVVTTVGMGSGVTAGSSGYGTNYSGFPNNSCFKITHYINCCGVWYRQTQCVSMGSTNLKALPGATLTPSITKSEVEIVDKKDLPKELRQQEESDKKD